MLKAKIFYIFLFLIVVETIGLLLKRGLEMGYFGTEAIILAVFHLLFTTYVHSVGSTLQ